MDEFCAFWPCQVLLDHFAPAVSTALIWASYRYPKVTEGTEKVLNLDLHISGERKDDGLERSKTKNL